MVTQTQVVTIVLETTMDSSQLLDIAIEIAKQLKDEVESYGEDVILDTGEISVSAE